MIAGCYHYQHMRSMKCKRRDAQDERLQKRERHFSQHEHMVDEITRALLHENHLRDIIAGRVGELLPPHNRDRPRTAKDRDRCSCPERTFFRLILKKLKKELIRLYGDNVDRVILYGSRAGGCAG